MNSLKFRFPGPPPFEGTQQDIFFGRDKDIKALYRYIKVEPIVVLQGKSGIGKSSLVNAGLIPELENEKRFHPIKIRFHSFNKGTKYSISSPTQNTGKAIRNNKKIVHTFLDKIINNEASLWHDIKEHQILHQDRPGILLIFDQFEELFSYPRKMIDEFQEQLAEALNIKVPQRYWDELEKMESTEQHLIDPNEMEIFYQQANLKLLFVVRHDKLHLLKQLDNYFSRILKNCFELKDLSKEAAQQAIVKPISLEHKSFTCLSFRFSPDALNRLLNFLTVNGKEQVDTTHLQIICHEIEKKNIKNFKEELTLKDLENLEEIIKDYYNNKIKSIGNLQQQQGAKRLIEDKLIYVPDKRRISLFEGTIIDFLEDSNIEAPEELLESLKKSRLLRAESTERGVYYELSHDRLVDPVLKSKLEYDEQEAIREKIEIEESLKKEQISKSRWQRATIQSLF